MEIFLIHIFGPFKISIKTLSQTGIDVCPKTLYGDGIFAFLKRNTLCKG